MSDNTGIEWCDATWNPVRGCSRVSEGCRNCYAERVAARFADPGEIEGEGWLRRPGPFHGFASVSPSGPRWTGRVELIPEKLEEPLRWRKPRRIFVNSMSDLFHERLRVADVLAVFEVMARCPQHTFQVLTKRPDRMRYLLAYGEPLQCESSEHHRLLCTMPLPNVWLGVSVEDQATADERIPLLLQTPAALRFVSYEPALGPVDFERACEGSLFGWYADGRQVSEDEWVQEQVPCTALDWLIVGGESGPGARPFDIAWARSAVLQCNAARVPVFVKQLGAWPYNSGGQINLELRQIAAAATRLALRDRKGGEPSEWPEDLRVREFPEARP